MAIKKQTFKRYIERFNFSELFIDLGWAYKNKPITKKVGDIIYNFTQLADKAGFSVLECRVSGEIPLASERKKIHHEIGKLFFEHLLIFTDEAKSRQIWEAQVKEPEKPRRIVSFSWKKGQDPEDLYQRLSGVFFSFEEDERGEITIIDVVERLKLNFAVNAEKVTKKFYAEFKKHHTSFMDFIEGIDDHIKNTDNKNKQWYASLMLNRLMFCYFIQRKGFLDGDRKYLENKLKACQEYQGTNFYSFYRSFLLKLFHNGLGKPQDKRNEKLPIPMGNIPYLNGGLFDVHELEKQFEGINIEDTAFEKIFGFFSQWNWHLDTSEEASGKDINPDVIGYIFEKYINDRANMGAYYTKEDITDYISKNTILPYLFDETERHYPTAFSTNGEIWTMLRNSGDRYVYEAVKKGVDLPLPAEIEAGVAVVSQRGNWNKSADSEYALPTEIWREVVDRRKRYQEVIAKISSGEITQINDLISYNLNIRQFVQDLLEETEDPELIRHFYKSLSQITIIDPTCGSGAFLFAALNILEPLYETCIQRMEGFVQEGKPRQYQYFETVLENINSPLHPNRKYFIYKSIILQNLYGVDIMKEAVEIAKLRLFLKLVAAVDVDHQKENMGLEPLPDIDFNIRAGNALVGIGNALELERALNYTIDGVESRPIIEEQCDIVARAFKRYKEIQLSHGDDFRSFKEAKDDLKLRLKELNHELNQLYHKQAIAIPYDKWLESHQPFHWFAEYYEIIKEKGGFDVIIGNPPYVEYKSVTYKISGYSTFDCGNLYAYIMERSSNICSSKGYIGMIIPLSGHSTDRMSELVRAFYERLNGFYIYNLSADANPSKLFEGVKFRLTIFFASNQFKNKYVTKYKRWYSDERNTIFSVINFNILRNFNYKKIISKISDKLHLAILKKIKNKKKLFFLDDGKHPTYYHNTPVNWIRSHDFLPYFHSERDGFKSSTQLKPIYFKSKHESRVASAILSSTTFFIWWISVSDCYHLNKPEVTNFFYDINDSEISNQLDQIYELLKNDLKEKAIRRVYNYKTSGRVEYDEFYLKKSKQIIDQIDTILAKHYGFTEEELDFIINYDIKYRMGKELEGDEAE